MKTRWTNKLTGFTAHPAALLMPPMDADTYAGFLKDVRKNGIREPVKIYDSQILDGVHRHKAAMELGVLMPWVELEDIADPYAYVVSLGCHRRHLTTSQAAMIAARISQASKDMTVAQAAEAMGVSTSSVKTARAVRDVSPAAADDVSAGRTSLNAAAIDTGARQPPRDKFVPPPYQEPTRSERAVVLADLPPPRKVTFQPSTVVEVPGAVVDELYRIMCHPHALRVIGQVSGYSGALVDELQQAVERHRVIQTRAQTGREQDALDMVRAGHSDQEVADAMGVESFRVKQLRQRHGVHAGKAKRTL